MLQLPSDVSVNWNEYQTHTDDLPFFEIKDGEKFQFVAKKGANWPTRTSVIFTKTSRTEYGEMVNNGKGKAVFTTFGCAINAPCVHV